MDKGTGRLRVVVIAPPLLLGRDFIDYPWFANLGALHTAGVLSSHGHDVLLLDALSAYGADVYPFERGVSLFGVPVARLLQPLDHALQGGAPLPVAAVVHHSPFLHPERDNPAFEDLLRTLRERVPDIRIILDDGYLGTMHYVETDRAALLLRHPDLDFSCQYETDDILPALLARIAGGSAPPRTAPAAERVFRQTRAVALDGLAGPAWDLVDAESYAGFLRAAFDRSRRPNPFRVAPDTRPIVTSRGCAFGCTFCSSNPYLRQEPPPKARAAGPRFRAVPLAALRAELELLSTRQGAHHLAVLDAVANLRKDFSALLDLFAERELVYDFPNGLRADRLTDDHLARMQGRIGTLSVSAESGNQDILDRVVKKGLRLAEVERVAREAAARAIPLVVHFMVGLPDEGRREVLDTLEWALLLHERYGAEPLMSFATPIPGTELFEMCQARGIERAPETADPAEVIQHAVAIDGSGYSAAELKAAIGVFRRQVRARAPRKLIVNLTYRCSNHCVFCAVGDPARPLAGGAVAPDQGRLVGLEPVARADAPLADVRQAMESARADGATLLDIDGGEPLLYPHLVTVIRDARRLGFERVTVTTNGRRLADEGVVAALLASGLHALLISLHGATAEVHDGLTGKPGSFRETAAGLKNVLRLMAPGFGLAVNTTVTRHNLPELMRLGERLAALGVPQWNLQLVTPFGRADTPMLPTTDDLASTLPPLLDRFGARLSMAVVNAPPCLLPGHERFVAADLGKLERHMLFVTKEKVNLADYLRQRREYGEQCEECLFRPACGGLYW